MTEADVVLQALYRWAELDGSVCAPVAEVAALTDLGEYQVARALRTLVDEGRLEFTGRRRGRTAVFHLTAQGAGADAVRTGDTPFGGYPGFSDTAPRADTSDGPEGPPSAAAADGDRALRPEHDDDELDDDERAARRQLGLEHLDRWLDRHDGGLGAPDAGGGLCGECSRWAPRRYSLGLYVLCRECRRLRAGAAERGVGESAVTGSAEYLGSLGDPVRPAEPPPLREAARELAAELAVQLSRNGNGNGSDLWSEPDF